MTSVSAGHILLTPTQPVGSGRPQRESNPGPSHQVSRALPQSYPRGVKEEKEEEEEEEEEKEKEGGEGEKEEEQGQEQDQGGGGDNYYHPYHHHFSEDCNNYRGRTWT